MGSVIQKLFLTVIFIFSLSGCNKSLRGLSAQSNLNTAPPEFETVDHPQGPVPDLPNEENPRASSVKPSPQAEEIKPTTTQIQASKIIYYAQKVIDTEARKLGTACNVFVNRVLTKAGFASGTYLAQDFDSYATKNFKHFRAVHFKYDASGSEIDRFKKYLWAYPERTAFIMQWAQVESAHGHIAFVERIADKLVIYQSSLGTQIAHRAPTTAQILLTGYNRRALTVYSEMIPR